MLRRGAADLEKLKAALEAGIESDGAEAQRVAVKEAIEPGLRKVRLEQRGEPVPSELGEAVRRAEEAVFSKIRERLGLERAEWCTIGAAPCPLDVLELGTVGPAIPGVEVRAADDGD